MSPGLIFFLQSMRILIPFVPKGCSILQDCFYIKSLKMLSCLCFLLAGILGGRRGRPGKRKIKILSTMVPALWRGSVLSRH